MRYHGEHLVPVRAGLTVAAPPTTWSPIPSFGYGVTGSLPNNSASLVSLSQKSSSGAVPSVPGPASSSSSPANGCWTLTAAQLSPGTAVSAGLLVPSQAQVLRNQVVGSTCTVAWSGPALVTLIRIKMSSGLALA
jgi:hypothetical protein